MVALVEKSQVTHFMEVLLTQFYQPCHGLQAIDSKHVFVTQPGPGAMILLQPPN